MARAFRQGFARIGTFECVGISTGVFLGTPEVGEIQTPGTKAACSLAAKETILLTGFGFGTISPNMT